MALGGGGGGNAGGIRAGRAYVELGADDRLSGKLKGIAGKFAEFGKKVLGAAGIGGLVSGALGSLSFKETADDLRDMNDAAKALGLSGRAASGLFGVLGAAGGDFKENVEGLTQFSNALQLAMADTSKTSALFEGLSISAKDLEGVPLDEQFYRIHEAIRELPQSQQAYKLGLVGGTDSMKKWLPLLSMSTQQLRDQAGALSLSTAELEQAAESSKAMKAAGAGIERAWQRVVVIVAPLITSLARTVGDALAPLADWLSDRDPVEETAIILGKLRGLWLDFEHAAVGIGIDVIGGFTAGWDLAILTVKNSVADLISFAGRSVRKALDLPLKVLSALDPKAGQSASDLLARGEGAADPVAKIMKENAAAEFANGAEIRRITRQEFDRQGAFDKMVNDLAVKDLEGRREKRKAAGLLADLMGMEIGGGQKVASSAAKSLGTFGAGSFLTQGFGRQGANDPAKEMVKEQQKANVLLKDVVNAVNNSVLRFS